MMEPIPRKLLPPLIGFLRTPTRSSQLFSPSGNLHLNSRLFPRSPRRFYVSPTTDPRPSFPAGPQTTHEESQQPPQQPPRYFTPIEQPHPAPRPKRSYRAFIYATAFFLLGSAAGQYIHLVILPPPLPAPGSSEDAALTAAIRARAAKLPLVKALSHDPAWSSWPAYSSLPPEEKPHRITSGPLGSWGGIGAYQRVFHCAATGEFICVVWVGPGVCGWPGVTHGGLIATLLDENMARCAIARFPVRTGVTAHLEFNYRRPAVTNAFYIVRALPVEEGSTERKGFVRGALETLDGKVCVEAKGLFVMPKLPITALKPVELKMNEGF